MFGRDTIHNIPYQANWKKILKRKTEVIQQNNANENKKRKSHNYKEGDKVLVKARQEHKYGQNPYEGPYTILKVNSNGTIIFQKGAHTDLIHLRQVKPFFE